MNSNQRPHFNRSNADKYSIKNMIELFNNPDLRLQDKPKFLSMFPFLMLDPDDPYLGEIFDNYVEGQGLQALASNDPFIGNYPPKGSVLLDKNGGIMAGMPTGDLAGFPDGSKIGSTVISGPTGCGKTSLLELLIPQFALHSKVIALDRKDRLMNLSAISFLIKDSFVPEFEELMLAMLEYPPGVSDKVGNIDIVDQLARNYSLFASRRIMLGSLETYNLKYPRGKRHLGGWIKELQAFKPGKGYREAGYKEAAYWVLRTLQSSTFGVLDYWKSNFLEKMFEGTGLVVIQAPRIPAEHLSFVWSYISRWIYTKRLYEK